MGKSRLIREVAARAAADGDCVAVARCYAGPGRIALSPVAEWLGSSRMRAHRRAARPGVAGGGRPAAAARARATGRDAAPSPMVDAWQRHHFFEGLARALLQPTRADAARARRPAVVRRRDAVVAADVPRARRRLPGPGAGRRPRRADARPPGARRHHREPARGRPLGRDRAATAVAAAATAALAGSVLGVRPFRSRTPCAGTRRPAASRSSSSRRRAAKAGAGAECQRGRPAAAGPGRADGSPAGGVRAGSRGGRRSPPRSAAPSRSSCSPRRATTPRT